MNEEQLKAILARNPEVTAVDHKTLRPILAKEPERRTPDAPDGNSSRKEQSQTRTFVCFVYRRIHLLDADAISGSGKDLLDGLQDAGLIPGDRETEIGFEALQQKVGRKRDQGTFIYVATGAEADRLISAKQAYRTLLLTILTHD